MRFGKRLILAATLAALVFTAPLAAQQEKPFKDLVGPVKVGDVKKGDTLDVPFLTWGGDVATFHANGGLTTKPGSIYADLGLKLNLTKGDDFVAQVKNYVEGKTPLLRGTFSQLGLASDVLTSDPKIKPVVFLQMTWSAGDHMVARPTIKTLNDLKGKKVALQTGGPHVGMLNDILRTANLKWKDITVVWAKDITGKDSASEMFKKDASLDACFAISPDMQGLTGGLDKKGTGAEGTVKDAAVLVSTATMKRSIADVYACRKDFFDANKETIEKFAAGYIKGCDELLDARAKKDPKFKAALKLAMEIYGKDTLPTEADAEGLVADALFVGHVGNTSFFNDKGNTSGFEAKMEAALSIGGAESAVGAFQPGDLDFEKKLPELVKGVKGKGTSTIPDQYELDKVLYTFKITFEVGQKDFSEEKYAEDFKKAIKSASLFGNAVLTINGHADPNKLVREFIKAGKAKGLVSGVSGTTVTLKDGKNLDLTKPEAMKTVLELVAKEDLGGVADTGNPKDTMEAADKLSKDRAEEVQKAVLKFATGQKFVLDTKQIKPVGRGVQEPVVPFPQNNDDAAKNRRVEFSIYSIKVKNVKAAEDVIFDF